MPASLQEKLPQLGESHSNESLRQLMKQRQ